MNDCIFNVAYYPVLCLGGGNQIDTAHMAAAAAIVLIFCLLVLAVSHRSKKPTEYKTGGDILVNRNDPTRDYIRWELMTWPDDWKDGDKLIFTVVEHKIVQSGPEVEVKK